MEFLQPPIVAAVVVALLLPAEMQVAAFLERAVTAQHRQLVGHLQHMQAAALVELMLAVAVAQLEQLALLELVAAALAE